MFGQQQSHHDRKTEHGNRVLLFQADARDHAKPQPISRIVALDRQYCEINAAHPQKGLEAVGGHNAAVIEIKGHGDERQSGEHHREPAAAEFPGDHGRQNDRSRGRQRRHHSNAPHRIAHQQPGDFEEDGNQGRMIHIAPGQMVSAGSVIELIAEEAIPIVEVKMQQEVREGEKEDDDHAIREKRLLLIVESGCLVRCRFHFGCL